MSSLAHLRHNFTVPCGPRVIFFSIFLFLCSTILVCKQRIMDLFPKLEKALKNITTAETVVMQMQVSRQREFWYLLKIACVSI